MTGPIQDLHVDAGGEILHARLDGADDRPTLLLLHGLLGSTRWWDRLVPLLQPDFRIARVDLAGHGRSSDHTARRAPQDQARFVRAVLDHLHLDPVATVGHSLGSTVAIALAEAGAATGALVVLGEGPDYSVANPPWTNPILRSPIIGPMIWDHLPDSAIRQAIAQFFAKGFDVGAVFDDRQQPVLDVRAVSHRTFERTQTQKEHYAAQLGLHHRIARLERRSLVVFGDRDRVFAPQEALRIYETVPRIETRLLPGVGHSSMLEAPEQVAGVITRFVSEEG
jgi:pimeloyl-ACP methyl ester carboxylesterase